MTPPVSVNISIEGTKIKVDIYNGNAQVGHEINDEWMWYGIVVPRARSWYTITKTDFCIMLTKPRKCPRHSFKVRCTDAHSPDEKLTKSQGSVWGSVLPRRETVVGGTCG